mmetsp:Transcript_10241/g.31631  ORF Transcript_10241/g.31631 Transcript_10241/m.31631 type:complete len:226 (-) Transcript_10241:383-1060(-)
MMVLRRLRALQQQQILRLHVAVDGADVVVHVLQRHEQLLHHPARLGLRAPAAGDEPVEDVASRGVLENNEDRLRRLEDADQAQHVRVAARAHRVDLAHDMPPLAQRQDGRLVHHLDRHRRRPAQPQTLRDVPVQRRAVHGAVGALREERRLAEEGVPAGAGRVREVRHLLQLAARLQDVVVGDVAGEGQDTFPHGVRQHVNRGPPQIARRANAEFRWHRFTRRRR